MTPIVWLDEPAAADRELTGGKGAGLAFLTGLGLRVPPAFVVTTAAFRRAVPETVRAAAGHRLAAVDPGGPVEELEAATAEVRARILEATADHPLRPAIAAAHRRLAERAGGDPADLAVAVRSSSAAEDGADRSFAGEHDTYLWVSGAEEVQERVRACWASLYTARAVEYRRQDTAAGADAMAVVVQRMVPARSAGVFMTLNPVNGDRSKIVIESVWGLGEPLVAGQADPDRFTVDKVTRDILRRDVAAKPTAAVRGPEGMVTAPVAAERRQAPSLTDAEVAELVRLARLLEQTAGSAQDGEFAVTDGDPPGNVHILQTRPETVWSRRGRPAVAGGRSALEAVVSTLASGGRDPR